MNTLDKIINENRKDYLCFDLLKDLYQNNEEFRKIIDSGVQEGEIEGFKEELWERIDLQNIRGLNSFEDVFREGYNIGGCTIVSRQLSYSFKTCHLCSGLLPLIKGTKNSKDGEHSWMISDNKIYDTSLMIVMNQKYANKLGYQIEAKYDPHIDPIYSATYEFTNDPELRGPKR